MNNDTKFIQARGKTEKQSDDLIGSIKTSFREK